MRPHAACGTWHLAPGMGHVQAQRNVELHKAQRAAEKQAHDLSLSLQNCKDKCEQACKRVQDATAKNARLADSLQTAEADLESVTRNADKMRVEVSRALCPCREEHRRAGHVHAWLAALACMRGHVKAVNPHRGCDSLLSMPSMPAPHLTRSNVQLANSKAHARAAEERAAHEGVRRHDAEAEAAGLAYKIDKAEAAVKLKDGQQEALRQDAEARSQKEHDMAEQLQLQVRARAPCSRLA